MTPIEIYALLKQVAFDNYCFKVVEKDKAVYLQAMYMAPDIVTGVPALQTTRKWLLSPHMTRSEVVQTAFKCCLTSMEHRTREQFTYRGRRIYGPHYDPDALWEICRKDNFDCRADQKEQHENDHGAGTDQ